MEIQNKLFLSLIFLFIFPASAVSLLEQFKQAGYSEIIEHFLSAEDFDSLYKSFDAFIAFLQAHDPVAKKLFAAKERFIRSKNREYYGTDFFGFFDESQKEGRCQISFYYSTHFHEFLLSNYPEFKNIPELIFFLERCRQIQDSCVPIFLAAAQELTVNIFSSGTMPVLLKIIKYLPDYYATKPHYDGTAFSLFLNSTDTQALLICPYKSFLNPKDFCPIIPKDLNSVLLIPGIQLAQFSIFPTPHIVIASGRIRYATVAFALRPDNNAQKNEFSVLPIFNH